MNEPQAVPYEWLTSIARKWDDEQLYDALTRLASLVDDEKLTECFTSEMQESGYRGSQEAVLTEDMRKEHLASGGTRCPYCESDQVFWGDAFPQENIGLCMRVRCDECEREWDDVYNLVDIKVPGDEDKNEVEEYSEEEEEETQ